MNRKIKAVFLSLASIIVIATLSGCTNQASEAANGDQLLQIQEKGEFVIATEGTYPPWSYHDEDNNLVGYDIEVARLVAEKLGVKATFVEGEWDGIFAGLDVRRYDTVANAVEITGEREEKYDFSIPYAAIHTAIIVPEDNEDITSFQDLNGKTTANTLTSTYAILAEGYGAQTVGVDALEQTIELVLAGRADATLNSDVSFYDYRKAHPDAKLKIAALTEEPVLVSLPVRRENGSKQLLEAINNALSALAEEGILTEISLKYFGTDVS